MDERNGTGTAACTCGNAGQAGGGEAPAGWGERELVERVQSAQASLRDWVSYATWEEDSGWGFVEDCQALLTYFEDRLREYRRNRDAEHAIYAVFELWLDE